MSNETPAEVLADFKLLIESDEPRGAGSYLIKLARICGRFERALAAGEVAEPVTEAMKHAQQALYWREKYEMLERDAKNRGLEPAPPADPAKASGSAPSIDLALIVEALEQSDPKAAGYPEPRSRHARALEVARQLLTTPPSSAQEVTEEMVNRACNAYDKKSTEFEDFSSEYPAMHAALTAALQEPRHDQ